MSEKLDSRIIMKRLSSMMDVVRCHVPSHVQPIGRPSLLFTDAPRYESPAEVDRHRLVNPELQTSRAGKLQAVNREENMKPVTRRHIKKTEECWNRKRRGSNLKKVVL